MRTGFNFAVTALLLIGCSRSEEEGRPMPEDLPVSASLSYPAQLLGTREAVREAVITPEELSFPMIFPRGCLRGEACYPGTWVACDSVAVVEGPLTPDRVTTWIVRNEPFEVQEANTLVLVPGVVRVARDTREGAGPDKQLYRAGDTLYVLDHYGEGFFHVWYQRGVFAVELFWPWERAGGFEISGEVLQELESEVWLRVETRGGIRGWVPRDHEGIAGCGDARSP